MIIEIYDVNGEYVKSVSGDEAQCFANVCENETYKEVQEMRSHSLNNVSAYLKSLKQCRVNEIKVAINTKVFDGDELSQERMLRAINAAEILQQDSVLWKLSDNSVAEVSIAELKEAFRIAVQEMSNIWLEV